jgi:hypothetical protein
MHFSIKLLHVIKRRMTNSSKNNTIWIEFDKRPNAIDSNAELLFTAKQVVKRGIAKNAMLMEHIALDPCGFRLIPYGIEFSEVRKEDVEELLCYSKSMGANRYRISA